MTEKLSNEYEEYKKQRFEAIDENLKIVRENIEKAALKSGRKSEDIKLMAVTKTVAPEFINHAISRGINLIGENRVQELLSKKDDLCLDGVDVHLIGHLQTNKVKQIVGEVSTIQSVDSVKVAKEISKQSALRGLTTDILLEVNIGKEESKTGFMKVEVYDACCEIAVLPSVKITGLMSVPPICEDKNILRQFFYDMDKLFVDISSKKLDNICMQILSLGMSSDYSEAIEMGANLVRVGSAIFGARQY